MGYIPEQKLTKIDSFRVFGDSIFVNPLPEIVTKHSIKETASKENIWGTFIYPKVRGSYGG